MDGVFVIAMIGGSKWFVQARTEANQLTSVHHDPLRIRLHPRHLSHLHGGELVMRTMVVRPLAESAAKLFGGIGAGVQFEHHTPGCATEETRSAVIVEYLGFHVNAVSREAIV